MQITSAHRALASSQTHDSPSLPQNPPSPSPVLYRSSSSEHAALIIGKEKKTASTELVAEQRKGTDEDEGEDEGLIRPVVKKSDSEQSLGTRAIKGRGSGKGWDNGRGGEGIGDWGRWCNCM